MRLHRKIIDNAALHMRKLDEYIRWSRSLWTKSLLVISLLVLQFQAAPAQDVAPADSPTEACDRAAADAQDKQRPANLPAVERMNADVAVSACEAAVRAAPQDPRMLYQLGRAYRFAKKLPEAAQYYEQAAERGSAIAAYNLAFMYENGQGVAADQQKNLYYLNQSAQAGFGAAAYKIGILYYIGKYGLPKDENLSKQWFYVSARDSYFLGKYRYAIMIHQSGVKPEKIEEVTAWLQRAIDQATPKELLDLCESLHMNTGGVQDDTTARDMCKRSAAAGNALAMYDLGILLEKGLGGPQDYAEARQWYARSASAGRADAANAIGVLLMNGQGGDKDLVGARKWFAKAAKGNNPDGINGLGVMFEWGWGGPQDKAEARRLYLRAIELGEKRFAAKNLKRVEAAAEP